MRDFIDSIFSHPSFSVFQKLQNLNVDLYRKLLEKEITLGKLDLKKNKGKILFISSDASTRTLKFANPFEIILHVVISLALDSLKKVSNITKVYALRPGKDLEKSKLSLIFDEIEKYIEYPIKTILQEKLSFLELLSLYNNLKEIKSIDNFEDILALSDGSYEVNVKRALLFLVRKEKVDKYLSSENLTDIEKYHKKLIFDDIDKEILAKMENNFSTFLKNTIFTPKKISSFYLSFYLKNHIKEDKNLFDGDTPLLDDVSLANLILDEEEYLILRLPYKEIESKFYMHVLKNKARELNISLDLFRIFFKTKQKVFIFETPNKNIISNIKNFLTNIKPFLEEDGEVYPIKLADRFSRDLSKKLIKALSYNLKSIIFGLNYREHDTDY